MNEPPLLLLCHRHAVTSMAEGPYSHSEQHSRYAKRFYKSLSKRQRRLRRKYIPRPSLHLPDVSSWHQMYEARQDQALITMTGFDFATFDWLSDKFAVLFDTHTPWNQTTGDIVTLQLQTRGRQRSITASDCLGLSLMWTRTRGSTTSLQMIFGLTQNPRSVYLRFGRCILISLLSNEPDARIKLPDIETLQDHIASVHRRHPLLENVWCTMDGVKLYFQEAGSSTVENAY